MTQATYTLTADATPARVAAGAFHTLALRSDGTVWAWGANGSGQLGDGTTTGRRVPAMVAGLTGVRALAAGLAHAVALDLDGVVWTWGDDADGQQGRGGTGTSAVPAPVPGLPPVTALAAGRAHTLARAADGTVWAWGANGSGQLGDLTTTPRSTPIPVPGLAGIVAIAAGEAHSLAVAADGTVYAWGANAYGQLGDGTTTGRTSPGAVAGVSGLVGVAAGQLHSVALAADGRVWAWGYNAFGQLGDGTTTPRLLPVPATIAGAAQVAAGQYHSVAVGADGTLWTWGANTYGQLGDGTTAARWTPTVVAALPVAAGVAAGNAHTVAVTGDGAVWTWGSSGYGQVGDGTLVDRGVPVAVSEAGCAWRTATPTISPNGGTFSGPQSVVLASATPGAVIHYTVTGVEPTEGDATVANGGAITVDGAVTVQARAWAAGQPASATATAMFALGVATPAIAPGGGTYAAPQTVTVAVATPGAEIRYTLDGSEPAEGSALYAGPLAVATATVLKAKGFKAGWTPSGTALATFTFDYGILEAPTTNPPAGTYTGAQSVTLTAAAGAEIRYTLDGSEPSVSAPVATGPVTIGASLVLKARAFQADWQASETLTAAYTIEADTVAPTVQVSVLPPANVAGWHTAAVRLVYGCSDAGSGVAARPPEAEVTTEGTGPSLRRWRASLRAKQAASR